MRSSANMLARQLEMKKIHASKVVSERCKWKLLYLAAAWASLAIVALMPVQMTVYFIWPLPETVIDWFRLFTENAVVGLIDMDLLLSIDYLLLAIIYLAFYVSLRKHQPSLITIALVLQLLAVSIYFASTSAFEMLSLSKSFETATSEAQKEQLLAAGQGMLATWQGTAFNVSYILGGLSLTIASIAMYKTDVFSKAVSVLGILVGIFTLVPPTVGKVGLIISLLSLIPLVPWLVLIMRRFLILKDE